MFIIFVLFTVIDRLHTHGYNLFAPAETVLYHLYSRQHRPTFQELQQQPSSSALCVTDPVVIEVQKRRSMRMVQHMLGLFVEVKERNEENNKIDVELAALQSLNENYFGLGEPSAAFASFGFRMACLFCT